MSDHDKMTTNRPSDSSLQEMLSELITEQVNPNTHHIDECATEEMLRLINQEDKLVPLAVEKEIGNIAKAVDVISHKIASGGRLFYIGAGTSGRIGILDASECPPTYGTSPELVQGVIAGGEKAVFQSVEHIEDDEQVGCRDVERHGINAHDVVVGISASGRTPYVLGAIGEAKRRGAYTIGLSNLKDSLLSSAADLAIEVVVGPEVITGSTRMKAGTAQKLVLNMLSTCTMIKLGKVYNNLMVDVQATNTKLRERSIRMVQNLTGLSREQAAAGLDQCNGSVKLAVMMLKSGLPKEEAQKVLKDHQGRLKQSLQAAENMNKGVN
jgi:N-acetylmuramic acid 6-phosphate etherase